MKWKWPLIIFAVLLVPLSPVLFRKRIVPLVSGGKTIAFARRPFLPVWNDSAVQVYADEKKVFSLWTDAFDFPMFIYPLPDGKRFLCDYDFDTAILVFVVDLNVSDANNSDPLEWPSNAKLRSTLTHGATNVVLETKGTVRLPSYAELQEVCDHLRHLSSTELNIVSFPLGDFGIYRTYASKDWLLLDLATNRHDVWPEKK